MTKLLFEVGSTAIGGGERVLLRIAKAIRKQRPDWTIHAIVLCQHGGLEKEYRETFHEVYDGPGNDKYRESAASIIELICLNTYDVVHAIDSFDHVSYAAKKCKETRFVQNVFPNVRTSPFRPSNLWLSDTHNQYAAIVTEFKANLERLPRPGREPHVLTAIPNGIDTSFWTPGTENRTIDVCWAARTDSEKGIDAAMALVPLLCAKGLEYRIITSEHDGPQDQLAKLAMEWPSFIHYSRLQPEDLRGVFRRTKVFLSTSTVEGMPATPLEAAACGCWPIVPAIDGLTECFTGLAGSLFDWPSSSEWISKRIVDTVRYASNTPQGDKDARKVAERYSVDAMVGNYLSLYERIVESSHDGGVA